MTAVVIRADARSLPLPDGSVDLVVTSPPYWQLRVYTDGGQVFDGQIGSEPTPGEYLDHLVECTAEWVRVLKPGGSLWVNLGDKYVSRGGHTDVGQTFARAGRKSLSQLRRPEENRTGLPVKSLIGLPWRYALACVDELGLILRRDQIWSKVNGLPESVDDRTRASHEYVFHLVRQPRYFSAIDEIREAHVRGDMIGKLQRGHDRRVGHGNNGFGFTEDFFRDYNPLGKLPGSVWEIPSEPLKAPKWRGQEPGRSTGKYRYFYGDTHDLALPYAEAWRDAVPGRTLTRLEDHYAAFPTELPRRIIQGWSPVAVCTVCGEGRAPVTDVKYSHGQNRYGNRYADGLASSQPDYGVRPGASGLPDLRRHATITGYACACPDPQSSPARPAIVLDPFGGTGTTALVASVLGRVGITADLSTGYCQLAEWRVADPNQRAKAMRVRKPPPQVDDQLDLFVP